MVGLANHQDNVANTSAPIESIGKYLSHADRTLMIPPWQREYVWQPSDSGEVGELLGDFLEFIESNWKEYWLGSVILSEENKASKDFWLIDGQQRSLTLLIFVMAAVKYFTYKDLLKPANEKHSRLHTLCMNCISGLPGSYKAKVKMDRGKADSILQSIYVWSQLADGEKSNELLEEKDHWTQTQKNLADVAEWIYEEKFKKGWISDDKFVDSLDRILNNVKVVELHVPTTQDALIIFDRINNRGADLNSADLVKNTIFQYEDDDNFLSITEKWREMRKTLGTSSLTRLRDPINLLRGLALVKQGNESTYVDQPLSNGQKITYNELTNFWGSRLNPNNVGNKRFKVIKSSEFVDELLSASDYLADFSREKHPKYKSLKLKELYLTRNLKIVQHYPVLMAGMHFQEDVFYLLSRQVAARTNFYYLSGERTQEFETLIPEWVFEVSKLDKDASLKDLRDIYKKYEINSQSFSNFWSEFQNWSYKDSKQKKKIRSVLSELSRKVDAVCNKEDRKSPLSYFEVWRKGSKYGWDIDHIGGGRSEPKESINQSIGNLVLLHPTDNRSRGKAKVSSKRANYDQSTLYLTKPLAGIKSNPDKKRIEGYFTSLKIDFNFDLDAWDETQIKKRTDFYFQILKDHLTVK
jgi:uncharacterized protein with ParB-like and HNH nuclease domain